MAADDGSLSGTFPDISGDSFTNLAIGVIVIQGSPDISDSGFTDLRFYGTTPLGSLPGSGVAVLGGSPSITHNTILGGTNNPTSGVYINPSQAPPGPIGTGAILSRNRMSGTDVGVQIVDANLSVVLSNDLIHGNAVGVESTDTSADSPPSTQGDVLATNETILDNAVDASVSYTTLTLDSSILGTPIDVVGNNGACAITYSRGSSAASINGFGNFSTNADPQFVDASSGNYHLQSTSPKTYHGLDAGKHIFRVYAVDPSGKKGNPRVIRFTVTK